MPADGNGLAAAANVAINHWMTLAALCLCMGCGALLAGIGWALDPTMKAFPCLPRAVRTTCYFAACGCAWRAIGLMTTASSPLSTDPYHLHLDIAGGWLPMFSLFLIVFSYVLSQKMDPAVRMRLDRRHKRDMAAVKSAQRVGGIDLARLAADGILSAIEPTLDLPPLQLSPETIMALHAKD